MNTEEQKEDYEVFGTLYEPEGLYNDTLQQVLAGLLSGINLHHGKLDQVKREDVLAGSDIAPATLDQYFKGTDQIMADIHQELSKIVGQIEQHMGRYKRDAVIRFLLENLRKQPLMLKILIALDDRHFWEVHLRNILLYCTVPYWWDDEDEIWDEAYEVFCFEFQLVLEWWSVSDFSEDLLEDAFIRVKSWIVADSAYRSGLSYDWTEENS